MSKVFIHVGAHKTASSFLQVNLQANARAFKRQGWKFVRFHREFDKARKELVKVRASEPAEEGGAKHLNRFFKKMKKEPQDLFLSYEGFLGSSSMAHGEIYANHAAQIKLLKENFPDRDIQIGFCIRNFADQVESSYNSRILRARMKRSFDEYVERISVDKLSWFKIVQNLSDTFGHQSLVLWTYEDFKKDGVAAFPIIVQAAGIDTTNIAAEITNPRNVSLALPQLKVLRSWQEVLREHLEVSQKDAKSANRKFRKILERFPRALETKGLLSLEKRKELTDHYEREVAAIREKWGDRMLDFSSVSS